MASEIEAMHAAGYSVGFLPLAGQVLRYPHPFHADIKTLEESGALKFVPPTERVSATLCLLHHPQVFSSYPHLPLRVRAEVVQLVAHHPPRDGAGAMVYDIEAVDRIVRDLFGRAEWAPVGPKVREAFRGNLYTPSLTREDWLNIINVDAWRLPRDGFQPGRPVIGRHSRPDPQKWPDTRKEFLAAYPDAADIDVRLMGYGAPQDEIVKSRPANWQVLDFAAQSPRRFLASLDFFSYYHSKTWIEAFGRSILEAIASGAIAILPEDFQPLFQEAALYTPAAGVAKLARDLNRDQSAYARQSGVAQDYVAETFGLRIGAERVERLIGKPKASSTHVAAAAPRTRTKVVFFTSNGVGMGHLTRALAVARRLGSHCEPFVASLSKAFGVAERDGIESTYLPYHKSVDLDYDEWHQSLERDITDLLAYHQPAVFVFDGNVPYPGMRAAFAAFPQIRRIWQRRGMWAPGAGEHHIKEESFFDAVIEPGELAEHFDRGLTRLHRNITIPVAPILYLRDGEALTREDAREKLGIAPDQTAVLMQLGSENNFDLSATRAFVSEALLSRKDTVVFNAEWLIRDTAPALSDGIGTLREFPISRYLAAFDFAVSSAGYNTFHENIFAALPTIFVANENPEQDEQWLRAHYAELRGLAIASRRFNLHALDAGLQRMLVVEERSAIREACLALDYPQGADQAAAFISDMAYLRR